MTSPFSSRFFRRAFLLLATLGLAAGLAGVIFHFRPVVPATSSPRVVRATSPAERPASGGSGPRANPASRSATQPPAGVPPPSRLEPASATVTRAFPSITALPPDWRDFRPESLTVAPYPDLPVKFTRTALRAEGRYVTWIGRNPDLPGASFVGVATAQGYDAILVIPGASQFSFHVRGDEVVMAESVPAAEGCGNDPVQPPKVSVPASLGTIIATSYAPGHEPVTDAYAETAALKVDLLVGYDAGTLTAAGVKSSDPAGYIDGQCKALVETANLALAQSGVTAFAWRYLGAVAAPAYPRTGKSLDDIAALSPGGALAGWVKSMQYDRGADQVLLLYSGESDFGGRGSSAQQVAVPKDRAVTVLRWSSSIPTYRTFAHELAHNFGCQHDRAHTTVNAPGEYGASSPDNDGYWCYGQLWTNPAIPGGGDAGTSGTIMSYCDWTIPYFSNPNISVHVTGFQVGWSWDPDLGTHQTGRAEADPKAAYNARVLNEQAATLSKFSEEIVVPTITEQPVGASVERGRTLSLSVKATGGGLAYQWLKGGMAISGATSSGYSKTAEDADAGSYSVTVSNFAGSVASNDASLTITVPPPPPPLAASSGGGGGGGAPSLWFLGLLGLVGWGRRIARLRT